MDETLKSEQEIHSGDVMSVADLFGIYRAPLYRFMRSMCGNDSDAHDLSQDVWLKVIKNFDRFNHEHFKSWLFRIGRNTAIDYARKMRPDLTLDASIDDEGSTPRIETIAGSEREPHEKASMRELGERVRTAVELLPPEQREVFLMRTEGDLPFKEIAAIQDVSINTALARMQYAVQKLRDVLKEDVT